MKNTNKVTGNKNAIASVRAASISGKGWNSFTAQIEECDGFAKKNGFTIARIVVTDDRTIEGRLMGLIDDAVKFGATDLIFATTSILAKSSAEVEKAIQLAAKLGFRLHFVHQASAFKKILLEYASELISQRIRAGIQRKKIPQSKVIQTLQ